MFRLTSDRSNFVIVSGLKFLHNCPEVLKKEIFRSFWLKVGREIFSEKFIFQQDNCPIHEANCVTSYLREYGIEILQWPAYFPDLNIIESLLAIVGKRDTKLRKLRGNRGQSLGGAVIGC